jgi:hypothetical protein
MKVTMRTPKRLTLGVVVSAVIALLGAAPGRAEDYSHVRIVRLSFVEGTVTVQRPGMTDWSTAIANTPLQEGFKLSTGQDSFAEVEFENGSTGRLGQLSIIDFTQLALMPSGGKVNRMTLERGYATFNVRPEGEDVYEVKAGDATFKPDGKSEFRVDLEDGDLRVEVFTGRLESSSSLGSGTLVKNDVLNIAAKGDQPYEVTQGITKDDWDNWVEQRDTLQAQAGGGPAVAPGYSAQPGGLYGWNDLYNYGGWNFVPGYGYAWFPDVAYGWAPYTMGLWCWYPGFGYTWISSEPWGWLPYHYGAWDFAGGFGWFWIPGGFDTWSPVLVTWYQGPGWIGWAPNRPRPKPGGSPLISPGGWNCTRGQLCIARIRTRVVEEGRPVKIEGFKAVNLSATQGHIVAQPDLQPTRLAMMPGVPEPAPAASLAPHKGTPVQAPAGEFSTARSHGSAAPRVFTAPAPASNRVSSVFESGRVESGRSFGSSGFAPSSSRGGGASSVGGGGHSSGGSIGGGGGGGSHGSSGTSGGGGGGHH